MADVLRDTLSIDVIEQKKASEKETFVFSGDRDRRAKDGTNDKTAAENGMKHAVLATLKDAHRPAGFGSRGNDESVRRL